MNRIVDSLEQVALPKNHSTYFACMDLDLRYRLSNLSFAQLGGFACEEEVIDTTHHDLQCDAREKGLIWDEVSLMTIESQASLYGLTSGFFGQGEFKYLFAQTHPIFNRAHKLIGICFQGTQVPENSNLIQSMQILNAAQDKFEKDIDYGLAPS